jgi:hypothetical protein
MRTGLFIIMLMVNLGLLAQANKTETIEKRIQFLHDAMIKASVDSLSTIASNNLSYGHSSGLVENKQAFIAKIVSGKSVFLSINTEQQTIEVLKNIAIVRHVFLANTNDNGVSGKVKLKILLIWQKEKGKWKLLARQAIKLT